MSETRYPGEEEALRLGYTVYCTAGNRTSATYIKPIEGLPYFLNLTVWGNEQAELFAVYKMVRLQVGPIAFPHKNIELFEQQIIKCLPEI